MTIAAPARTPRRRRTDRLASMWLLAALVIGAIGLGSRSVLPQPLWTLVHVITLGVLTNAILQWSWYFTRTLLRLPDDDHRAGRDAAIRTITFNALLVALFTSMWLGSAIGTACLASAIGFVIAWHGLALLRASRTRLASRFSVLVRFYVVASAFLVVGCAIAGLIAVAMFAPVPPRWILDHRDDLTVAHAVVNVGGWIGLSIAGTLVTLGPTMLRTRMSPQAVSSAVAALPWLAAGVAGAAIAATMGWPPGVGIGLLVFAAALAPGVLLPLARAALGKSPSTYATWTLTAGLGWIVVSVAAVAIVAMTSATTADMRVTNLPWLALLGIGGAGQVFVGALTYLLPVVVGGGPSALRRGMSVLEVGWPTRIAVRNAALGLVAIASASGSDLGSWWWGLVLMTYALDVTLLSVAGARQARAKVAALRTRAVAGAAGTEDAPSGGSRD